MGMWWVVRGWISRWNTNTNEPNSIGNEQHNQTDLSREERERTLENSILIIYSTTKDEKNKYYNL